MQERKSLLPLSNFLDTAKAIAAGMAALHRNGIMHRDLTPANILLDGQWTAKIANFGNASFLAQRPTNSPDFYPTATTFNVTPQ